MSDSLIKTRTGRALARVSAAQGLDASAEALIESGFAIDDRWPLEEGHGRVSGLRAAASPLGPLTYRCTIDVETGPGGAAIATGIELEQKVGLGVLVRGAGLFAPAIALPFLPPSVLPVAGMAWLAVAGGVLIWANLTGAGRHGALHDQLWAAIGRRVPLAGPVESKTDHRPA
ncbi:hypothetical protein BH11PSE2_BH11PSE2_18830 [soil metagenome]